MVNYILISLGLQQKIKKKKIVGVSLIGSLLNTKTDTPYKVKIKPIWDKENRTKNLNNFIQEKIH